MARLVTSQPLGSSGFCRISVTGPYPPEGGAGVGARAPLSQSATPASTAPASAAAIFSSSRRRAARRACRLGLRPSSAGRAAVIVIFRIKSPPFDRIWMVHPLSVKRGLQVTKKLYPSCKIVTR